MLTIERLLVIYLNLILKYMEGHADVFLDRYAYTPSII